MIFFFLITNTLYNPNILNIIPVKTLIVELMSAVEMSVVVMADQKTAAGDRRHRKEREQGFISLIQNVASSIKHQKEKLYIERYKCQDTQ